MWEEAEDPPTCTWGSETLDTLHGPRSRSSDCRATSEMDVHTCRPPNHSCQGLVLRCGAKDGRGVRLGLSRGGRGRFQGAPNSHFYNPRPGRQPGLTHTGVPLRSVLKPGGG